MKAYIHNTHETVIIEEDYFLIKDDEGFTTKYHSLKKGEAEAYKDLLLQNDRFELLT